MIEVVLLDLTLLLQQISVESWLSARAVLAGGPVALWRCGEVMSQCDVDLGLLRFS